MNVNQTTLDTMFKGFNAVFNKAFGNAPRHYEKIVTKLQSSGSSEVYGWMSRIPQMREWIGDRVVNRMSVHGYEIINRKFEATVTIARDDISDDKIGVYAPLIAEMGRNAAAHPDELVFQLLASGFAADCYDGQPFFDPEHPVIDAAGVTQLVSNMQAGSSTPWYLLDTTRAIGAVMWQEREPYTPQALTSDNDETVFMRDEFLYGTRARVNAGFGLWQMAFGSKATLDATNYAAARAAMMGLRADHGRILGITPSLLVVPPALESAARQLLVSLELTGGGSNEWAGSAELLVTPYLAA